MFTFQSWERHSFFFAKRSPLHANPNPCKENKNYGIRESSSRRRWIMAEVEFEMEKKRWALQKRFYRETTRNTSVEKLTRRSAQQKWEKCREAILHRNQREAAHNRKKKTANQMLCLHKISTYIYLNFQNFKLWTSI